MSRYASYLPPKRRGWTVWKIVAIAALSVLVVIGILFAIFLWYFLTSPHGTTDVKDYSKTVRGWDSDGLVMPREIPADATDVRFTSLDPFLQGGGWVQVAYRLPEDEFNSTLADIKTHAIADYSAGDDEKTIASKRFAACQKAASRPLGIGFSWHIDDTDYRWPSGYHVYVYSDTCTFNHGLARGAAVNPDTYEVVYGIDDW